MIYLITKVATRRIHTLIHTHLPMAMILLLIIMDSSNGFKNAIYKPDLSKFSNISIYLTVTTPVTTLCYQRRLEAE